MKISARLLGAFIIVAIVAGGIGLIGVLNIQKITDMDSELYNKMTVPLSEMVFITDSFQRMRGNVREVLLTTDYAAQTEIEDKINTRNQEFETYLTSFEKTLLTDEGKAVIRDLRASKEEYDAVAAQVVSLAKQQRMAEALNLLSTQEETIRQETQTKIGEVTNMKINLASQSYKDNAATAKSSTILMIGLLAFGMVLSVALGLIISATINRPIKTLMVAADKISKGDLDVDIDINSKDEIGILADSFKRMSETINDVMMNINIASTEVAAGSRELADSSMGLSQGATEQASSIEQLTASINEIAVRTNQNAENANEANDVAINAKENADQGNMHMNDMLDSMSEINESSANISKIIKVIDEIAFQTNILALNAAVEAARAGQHGKGFAVVAEEVRNLAARSAAAARETTELIEGSIKKVETGTKTANDTAQALAKIVDGISKVSGLIGEIADASRLQASGISQINIGIEQVSQVIQSNSATAEESAAASEELTSQANLLKETVQKFRLKRTSINQLSRLRDGGRDSMTIDLDEEPASFKGHSKYQEKSSGEPRIALSDKEFGKYN